MTETKAPADREALIEFRAEQLWQADSMRVRGRPREVPWSEWDEDGKAPYRHSARFTLEAEEAAGVRQNKAADINDLLDAYERMACFVLGLDVDGQVPPEKRAEYDAAIDGCRGRIEYLARSPYAKEG